MDDPLRRLTKIPALVRFFLFGLFLPLFFTAQQPAKDTESRNKMLVQDTTAGSILLELAMNFQDSMQYDSALSYYSRALTFFDPAIIASGAQEPWEKFLQIKNQQGRIYLALRKHQIALALLDSAYQTATFYLPKLSLPIADNFTIRGKIKSYFGDWEQSSDLFQRAISLYENLDSTLYSQRVENYLELSFVYLQQADYEEALLAAKKARSLLNRDYVEKEDFHESWYYNNLGNIYRKQGNYKRAKEAFKQSLLFFGDSIANSSLAGYAALNFNLCLVYRRMQMLDSALVYCKQALELDKQLYHDKHRWVADDIKQLGVIARLQGDYKAASMYFQRALSIRKSLDQNHINKPIADLNTDLGLVKWNLGQLEESLSLFETSLRINQQVLQKDDPEIATNLANIALVYMEQGKFAMASTYYQRALRIYEKAGKEDKVADMYSSLGHLFWRSGDFERSLRYSLMAIDLYLLTFGRNSSQVSETFNSIGERYLEKGNLDEAIEYFQKAIKSIVLDFASDQVLSFPKSPQQVINNIDLLTALYNKALVLERRSETVEPQDLFLALDHLKLSIAILDKALGTARTDELKLELLTRSRSTYETALRISYKLLQISPSDSLFNTSFAYFEKSKATLLRTAFAAVGQEPVYGLPKELFETLTETDSELTYYEKSIYEESSRGVEQDSAILRMLKDERFILNQTKDSLLQIIAKDFPSYYDLKYDMSTSTLPEIQEILAEDQGALLEYFEGDSAIYVFVVQPEHSDLLKIKKDFPLKKWIKKTRNSIYGYHLSPEKSQQSYEHRLDTLTDLYHRLYQKLFAPITEIHDLPERLIISPDGVLGYLPFELQLKERPKNQYDIGNYAFLIRDHWISYTASATLLKRMKEKESSKVSERLLSIAPTFKKEGPIADNSTIDQVRSQLSPLSYNLAEAAATQRIFGGRLLEGEHATKQKFIEHASECAIIHLATHGKANDQMGDYSYLAFASHSDSLTHEKLYNRELYNLTLNSEMVVLSACETGIGELQKGEGIISLARGFSYAGAKSIITSLWSVNDKSTAEIMELFYQNLKKGLTKDAALQQAKLTYLDSQLDPMDQHPFFWAAFIPMGDMAPLSARTSFDWRWLSLILIAFFVYYMFKKNRISD